MALLSSHASLLTDVAPTHPQLFRGDIAIVRLYRPQRQLAQRFGKQLAVHESMRELSRTRLPLLLHRTRELVHVTEESGDLPGLILVKNAFPPGHRR
jgi:hypothetical protein